LTEGSNHSPQPDGMPNLLHATIAYFLVCSHWGAESQLHEIILLLDKATYPGVFCPCSLLELTKSSRSIKIWFMAMVLSWPSISTTIISLLNNGVSVNGLYILLQVTQTTLFYYLLTTSFDQQQALLWFILQYTSQGFAQAVDVL
jgi:hypothetical protein